MKLSLVHRRTTDGKRSISGYMIYNLEDEYNSSYIQDGCAKQLTGNHAKVKLSYEDVVNTITMYRNNGVKAFKNADIMCGMLVLLDKDGIPNGINPFTGKEDKQYMNIRALYMRSMR